MEQIEKFVEEVRKELQSRVLRLGGAASDGALVGVCVVNADAASSYLARDVGARFRELEQTYGVRIVGVRYDSETNECFYTLRHGDVKAEVKIV